MNNEETIVMQPQDNSGEAEQLQNVETSSNNNNEKDVATIAAAVVVGEVVGNGITYAATEMINNNGAAEGKPEEEVQTAEESAVAAAEEPQKEEQTAEESVVAATEEPQKEKQTEEQMPQKEAQTAEAPVVAAAENPKKEVIAAGNDEETNAPIDYTGCNGADPITPNPRGYAATDKTNSNDANEVQVLGVYEAQGIYGQTMQAAVLTNGEEFAAVFDLNGDGVADVLAIDENHNWQIDEGEVYDLSNDKIQMADYQQAYLAQQQEQIQQENNTFVYNANDDQQDYNNNADLSFA